MSYRPKDWVKPWEGGSLIYHHRAVFEENNGDITEDVTSARAQSIYEAGADAMLEALRKGGCWSEDWTTGWFSNYGIKIKPTHKSSIQAREDKTNTLAAGWLVFIPEDDNEEITDK